MLETLSYNDSKQLYIFNSTSEKDEKLAQCIDRIEEKFGKNSIKAGFWNS